MAIKGGKAPSTAAAEEATRKSLELQNKIYEEGKGYAAPYYDAGKGALGVLQSLIGQNKEAQFMTDPGYQFRRGEGEKALLRRQAARGRYGAPDTDKALMDFNQNLASQEYGNVFDRVFNVANYGPQATGQIMAAGQNYANSATDLYTNLANAQMAAAAARRKNNTFGTLASLAGAIGSAYVGNPGFFAAGGAVPV